MATLPKPFLSEQEYLEIERAAEIIPGVWQRVREAEPLSATVPEKPAAKASR